MYTEHVLIKAIIELGDEAASFTKEEMQQGKHTEYEKNLHDELSMSSTVSHHSSTSITPPDSSLYSSPNTTNLVSKTNSSGDVTTTVASVVAATTNGRATSENSDKFSSRTPSPQHQMTNGGWPNLMENSKRTRYVFDEEECRYWKRCCGTVF